jgi:hypothetical protein
VPLKSAGPVFGAGYYKTFWAAFWESPTSRLSGAAGWSGATFADPDHYEKAYAFWVSSSAAVRCAWRRTRGSACRSQSIPGRRFPPGGRLLAEHCEIEGSSSRMGYCAKTNSAYLIAESCGGLR